MLLAHLYFEVQCVVCREAPLWAVPLRDSPQLFSMKTPYEATLPKILWFHFLTRNFSLLYMTELN